MDTPANIPIIHTVRLEPHMIELDIQACKTGELIIYHDVMISGIPVCDLSLKQILKKNKNQ